MLTLESKKIDATFEERTSKEGKTYKCVVLHLADNYEKLVFLSIPEIALLESSSKSSPYDY